MPNDDLISRKALLEKVFNKRGDFHYFREPPEKVVRATDVINAPAVDAVEVVRCKDCKFSKTLENIPNMQSYRYCIALKDVINFGDYFYCAHGAKMETHT